MNNATQVRRDPLGSAVLRLTGVGRSVLKRSCLGSSRTFTRRARKTFYKCLPGVVSAPNRRGSRVSEPVNHRRRGPFTFASKPRFLMATSPNNTHSNRSSKSGSRG